MKNNKNILVLDSDPKNQKIFDAFFSQAHYKVHHATTNQDALNLIGKVDIRLVLSELTAPGIDGYQLLDTIQRRSTEKNIAVVFLTQKSDVWHRVKSFKLGAKDYIVKPKHIKEIVQRVDMVLRRLEKHSTDHLVSRRKMIGRLHDFSVTELVEMFGVEQKTGILSVFKESGTSGQIFFDHGIVVNATCKTLDGERAFLKMLPWASGRFSMLFTEVQVTDQIGISNIGLLLQGAQRMENREELLKQLPSLSAVMVTSENFRKIIETQELQSDLSYFISLFDGERSLADIIDESKYDENTTLRRILKLYQLGFLKVVRDLESKETPSPPPPEQEEENLQDNLDDWDEPDMPDLLGADKDSESENALPDHDESQEPILADSQEPDDTDQEDVDIDTTAEENEESDPFSIFRSEAQSEPFGFDQWESSLNELEVEDFDFDFSSDKHPADELFRVESEDTLEQDSQFKDLDTPDFSKAEEEPAPEPDTHEKARQRFRQARGGVLILGNQPELNQRFIDSLVDGEALKEKAAQETLSDIYFGTAVFAGSRLLNVIGLLLDKDFTPFFKLFSDRTIGMLLMIDPRHADWHYLGYIYKTTTENYKKPVIIVLQETDNLTLTESDVRKRLLLDKEPKIKFLSTFEKKDTRRILFGLFEAFVQKNRSGNSPHFSNL